MNNRLRKIRKERHLSQEEFGKKIGIESRAHISALENGNRTITDRIIKDVCREFSVNEEWLRTGNGDMYKAPNDEVKYYVEDLLSYNGKGNPFYDMIIEMMKTYHNLDNNSQKVMREYFQAIGKALEEKKIKDSTEVPSDPEEFESLYPPIPDDTANAG